MSLRRLPALAACLALALVPAGCGSGGSASGSDDARKLLEDAAAKQVKSADAKFSLTANLEGGDSDKLTGPLKLQFSGPFRSNGQRKLPDLDWKFHGEAAGRSLDARLVTVVDNAFVEYQGTAYEVGEQLVKRFTQQQAGAPEQDFRSLGIDPSGWLKNAEVEDGYEIGGDPTRKVSREVDLRKVLESVNAMFAKPAVKSQLPPGTPPVRLPEKAMEEIEDAVDDMKLEVNVGRDDGILRRVRFEASFKTPEKERSKVGGVEGGELKLDFEQTNIDGDQRIEAPTDARDFSELLRAFGVPPELLLGPGALTPSPG